MGILTNLAATYSTSSYYRPTSSSDDEIAAIFGVITIVFIVLFLVAIYYVVSALLLGALFKKAGIKSNVAWIPFYRQYKFLQIGGQNGNLIFASIGGWAAYLLGAILTTFAPAVGVLLFVLGGAAITVFYVFKYIAAFNIGKKLGKAGIMVLFYIVSELIWWAIIIGTDQSVKWNDQAGKKRLDK